MKLDDRQMQKAFDFWRGGPREKYHDNPHAQIAVPREPDVCPERSGPDGWRTSHDVITAWDLMKWGAERSAVYLAEVDRLQNDKNRLLEYQRELVRHIVRAANGGMSELWCREAMVLVGRGPGI
jgi:hypothetical protein